MAGDAHRHPTPRAGTAPAEAELPLNVSAYPSHGIVKEPAWTWEVPAYFFAGGMAGACAMLAFAAQVRGRERLARRARLGALAALSVSPPLLISDLGRPERFYNMLRVFRPTSPMNMGTWILSAFGSALGGAVFTDLTGRLKTVGRLGAAGSAALGPALATYTGVLVAQTSIPAWHQARRHLPFLFAASALASSGGLVAAVTPAADAGPARRLAVAGAVAEIAAAELMRRSLGAAGDVYEAGPAGSYESLSRGLSLGGGMTMLLLGRRRWGAMLGGAAIMGGALSQRFAVWKAGFESARRT